MLKRTCFLINKPYALLSSKNTPKQKLFCLINKPYALLSSKNTPKQKLFCLINKPSALLSSKNTSNHELFVSQTKCQKYVNNVYKTLSTHSIICIGHKVIPLDFVNFRYKAYENRDLAKDNLMLTSELIQYNNILFVHIINGLKLVELFENQLTKTDDLVSFWNLCSEYALFKDHSSIMLNKYMTITGITKENQNDNKFSNFFHEQFKFKQNIVNKIALLKNKNMQIHDKIFNDLNYIIFTMD